MSGYETWLQLLVPVFAVVWLVHYFVWRRELADLDEGVLLDRIGDWEVRVIDDPEDGRSVSIAIELERSEGPSQRIHAVLSSNQAREVAQWLRVAAAPGQTLAIARLNAKKEGGE